MQIDDDRLKRRLGVRELRWPPDYKTSGTEKINAGYENARGLEAKFANIRSSAEITATSADGIAEIIRQQASASEQILIALKEISAGVENFTVATDNISLASENVRKISEDLNNASRDE